MDSNTDLCNLLSNPDKWDESDPDHILDNISSDYYCQAKKLVDFLRHQVLGHIYHLIVLLGNIMT